MEFFFYVKIRGNNTENIFYLTVVKKSVIKGHSSECWTIKRDLIHSSDLQSRLIDWLIGFYWLYVRFKV